MKPALRARDYLFAAELLERQGARLIAGNRIVRHPRHAQRHSRRVREHRCSVFYASNWRSSNAFRRAGVDRGGQPPPLAGRGRSCTSGSASCSPPPRCSKALVLLYQDKARSLPEGRPPLAVHGSEQPAGIPRQPALRAGFGASLLEDTPRPPAYRFRAGGLESRRQRVPAGGDQPDRIPDLQGVATWAGRGRSPKSRIRSSRYSAGAAEVGGGPCRWPMPTCSTSRTGMPACSPNYRWRRSGGMSRRRWNCSVAASWSWPRRASSPAPPSRAGATRRMADGLLSPGYERVYAHAMSCRCSSCCGCAVGTKPNGSACNWSGILPGLSGERHADAQTALVLAEARLALSGRHAERAQSKLESCLAGYSSAYQRDRRLRLSLLLSVAYWRKVTAKKPSACSSPRSRKPGISAIAGCSRTTRYWLLPIMGKLEGSGAQACRGLAGAGRPAPRAVPEALRGPGKFR